MVPWSMFNPKTAPASGVSVGYLVFEKSHRRANSPGTVGPHGSVGPGWGPPWGLVVRTTAFVLQGCFSPGSEVLHAPTVRVPQTGCHTGSTGLPGRALRDLSAIRETTACTTLVRATEGARWPANARSRRPAVPGRRPRRRAGARSADSNNVLLY